jgi:hypothetical protein
MSALACPLEDFDLISVYTRQQAIEDGVLVDASTGDLALVTRQHFRIPVAMTAAVYGILERAIANPRHANDYLGVWHDVCSVLRTAISRRPAESSTPVLLFRVLTTGAGRSRYWTLKAVVGPDDLGAPCFTIMLPEED